MLFLLGRKFHPAVTLVAAVAVLVAGVVLHLEFLTLTGAMSTVLAGAKTARRVRLDSTTSNR